MAIRLAEKTLAQLIAPEGHACSCGKVHTCGLKVLRIGQGAVNALPEAMETLGVKKVFVVYDKNTYAAAGEKVEKALENVNHVTFIFPMDGHIEPNEYAVGSLIVAFDPTCDVILAVGSGVVNDCCKVAAKAIRVPSMVVCTAPSMDGYASNSSSMIQNRVKVSLYNGCPQVILADPDILATAPDIMLKAGLGDMLAKYIALCEWRVAHIVHGDPYCEEIAELMRASLRKIVAHADGLMKREPAALEAVTEGLVLSGLAMAFAENSRPASGLEHYFSHLWEMQALRLGVESDLHGIQVGVGTLLTLWIYENVLNIEQPDAAKARQAMKDFSMEKWTERVHEIFGVIAPEILELEEKTGKNSPVAHEKRLQLLLDNWAEVRKIIAEELPSFKSIHKLMSDCGLPMKPADLNLTGVDTMNAFLGSRDIRDKYLTSNILWDLGLFEETAVKLKEMNS